MTPRKKTTPGPIGPDIDLEEEDVRLPDGSRLTDDRAAALAERALARRLGRPSVTGEEAHTPSLTVREPDHPRSPRGNRHRARSPSRRLAAQQMGYKVSSPT